VLSPSSVSLTNGSTVSVIELLACLVLIEGRRFRCSIASSVIELTFFVVFILLHPLVDGSASNGTMTTKYTPHDDATAKEADTVTDVKPISIIVVGAGMAGLSLALAVSNLNHADDDRNQCRYKVHVLEKRPVFAAQAGATLGLAVPGQKVLGEIHPAALAQVRQQGIFLPETKGYMIPWWIVRDALLDAVRQRGSIEIELHMGVSLLDIQDDKEGVRVRFHKNKGDHDSVVNELHGAILVGCDGVRSQVRQILGLPPAKKVKNLWRGNLTVPPNSTRLRPLLDQGTVPLGMKAFGQFAITGFNFHPLLPNTMAWTLIADKDVPGVQQGVNVMTLMEENMNDENEKALYQEIFDMSKASDVCHVLDYCVIDPEESALFTWSGGWGGRGRITLAGDAAHCQRAKSGLGVSMAFEDSLVLAREIAAAGSLIDAAVVQQFERTRFPRVNRIWKDEWEGAEYFTKTKERKPLSEEYTKWINAGIESC